MLKRFFLLVSAVSLFLFSCTFFNHVTPSSLTVRLPEASTRSELKDFVSYYVVTASCPQNGYMQLFSTKGKHGTDIRFDNLEPGLYTITVAAYESNSIMIAEGTDSVTVTSGKNSEAFVTLSKVISKILYVSFDSEKFHGDDDPLAGISPDHALNIDEVSDLIDADGYTIYINDITSSDNYHAITEAFAFSDYNLKNIVLQATGDTASNLSWTWDESGPTYGLTLGKGIKSGSTTCKRMVSLTLGDDFEEISQYGFSGCTALTKVVLGKNVRRIGLSAFYGCEALTSIVLPVTTDRWYQNGMEVNRDNIYGGARAIITSLTAGTWERAAAAVSMGGLYGVWSGKLSDLYYKNFQVADSVGKFNNAQAINENIIDFTFDRDGNLYTLEYTEDSKYLVSKRQYSASTHSLGEKVTVLENDFTSQILSLYSDMNSNIIYIKQSNTFMPYYKASEGVLSENKIRDVSNVNKVFAVSKGGYVCISDANKILTVGKIVDGSIVNSEEIGTIIYGENNVTGISETSNMEVTDLQIIGDYLYVLVRQLSNGFYSRGAILKFLVKDTGSLEFKGKLGWYGSSALNLETDSITEAGFKAKYFAGPEKFIAIKPKELVFADDGGFFARGGKYPSPYAGNFNRIVRIDLESVQIKGSYDVDAKFDKEIGFGASSEYITDVTVKNAN